MIFEDMKKPETKASFLDKRRSAVNCDMAEVHRMEDYILTDRFDEDIQRLADGDYFFHLPTLILLRKGQSDRKRKVYRFSDENKIILQFLTYLLMEKYDDRFPDSLYSFRRNRPIANLYSAIRNCDPTREKYIIKADIRSYGESIDTEILGEQLKSWLADESEVRSFIMWLVTRNEFIRNGQKETGFTSVLPGNPIVSFLQNIYLLDADQCIAADSCLCSRYTDDIFVICNDRESAERKMRELKEIIYAHKLTMNEEKTRIVPPGESYDLLGLKFASDYLDIADNTYNKVTAKMKHRADSISRKVRSGELSAEIGSKLMADFIRRYFYGLGKEGYVSWTDRFFPYITSTARLQRLDQLSQDCLRYIATGRHTNAKYRFRYTDIKSLGYIPLVHAYYHRINKKRGFLAEAN